MFVISEGLSPHVDLRLVHGPTICIVEGSERSFALTDTTAHSLPPPPGDLTNMPPEVSASKQSFHQAMGNPCQEYFIDVM